jgi:hypothetical protein
MRRIVLWFAGVLASLFCLVHSAQAQTASDYTQGVAVSGAAATIWFQPATPATSWTDVHYRVNAGATQNLRMTWNSATGRSEQGVQPTVAQGDTITYSFTYDKSGLAYDTPSFTFTVGGSSGGTVAIPTFSPAPGTYGSAQSVTLATTTAGASIRYTTDGSTPAGSSPTYSGPINVSATTTVKAIATKSGMTDSAVASGLYTINVSGSSYTQGVDTSSSTAKIWFQSSQGVSFVDVHYSVNGGGQQNFRMTAMGSRYEQAVSPTTSGDVITYSFTYSLTGSPTADSPQYSFTIGTSGGSAATPTFSPAPGSYSSTQTVSLASATSGATIKYTTDGSTPTSSSATYSGPLSVAATQTINAIAIKSGLSKSAVASGTYTINASSTPVATPAFSPLPGTYTSAQSVTLTSATSGATIKYTTDGSTPTSASPTYSGAISVTANSTIKAIAIKSGLSNSAVASGDYIINSSGSWNGLTTFNIVNQTKGKWADSQVYWAIIGKDWATDAFVHVDASGKLVPMSMGDNGQLTKNGQTYSNYFHSLAEKSSITIPAINSARILMSVGTPMYIKVVLDGNGKVAYAGANIENPSDPNIDVVFDFGEFAILPKTSNYSGIYINTTRVDQYGFPLKLRVLGMNGFDQTVGEPLTEGREELFQKFIAEVPAEFRGLAQAPYYPYRIMAPSHATFLAGEANANYLDPYVNQVWNKYTTQDLVINLNNGWPTFTGRVVNGKFQFTDGEGTYYINGKPSTSMVMLGNGLLDDSLGVTGPVRDKQLQLQAQMCAALNRHVAEDTSKWFDSSAFYPAGSLANWYAKFWHDHSINALAYGFAYDDVGNFSPSIHTEAPTSVTYTIGW